ncbi:hypothetical protein PanWU01x14_315500 [Parasponia andersonii]|uniref:Uncharacterized protein n=1 Tax=Parasponia andersonii TaxID=3476 RepID=A0A2P5ANB2_PARAD|nr:hypothetical protein PanWU01x14_315500 [Parasponia andersonii]
MEKNELLRGSGFGLSLRNRAEKEVVDLESPSLMLKSAGETSGLGTSGILRNRAVGIFGTEDQRRRIEAF